MKGKLIGFTVFSMNDKAAPDHTGAAFASKHY